MTKKHFIALVKMGGQYQGKIGQHSTEQESAEQAIRWAKERFSRPFAMVEMPAENLSIDLQQAEVIYNNSALYSPNI